MSAFIAYVRVSTQKQGDSGLGLEAQAAAISAHVGNGNLVATYTEVESGKRNDRPELAKALRHAKAIGATLLVAKLDRLARNVHFVSGLMSAGVDFVACDNPNANRLTVHILAAVAEDEAARISARTKAALAAAKARGVTLGGFRGCVPTAEDRATSATVRSTTAATRASALVPIISELRAAGATSLRDLANGLNVRGIPAPRGGEWSAVQVQRMLARAA